MIYESINQINCQTKTQAIRINLKNSEIDLEYMSDDVSQLETASKMPSGKIWLATEKCGII